jgi:hypothetical protein
MLRQGAPTEKRRFVPMRMWALLLVVSGIVWGIGLASDRRGGLVNERDFKRPDLRKLPKETAAMPNSVDEGLSAPTGVLNKHRVMLMAIDGVLGVGLGQDRVGNDAIVAYVRDQGVAKSLPRELDGLSVQIEVTGPIDALDVK